MGILEILDNILIDIKILYIGDNLIYEIKKGLLLKFVNFNVLDVLGVCLKEGLIELGVFDFFSLMDVDLFMMDYIMILKVFLKIMDIFRMM